jgi:hypothetical protein
MRLTTLRIHRDPEAEEGGGGAVADTEVDVNTSNTDTSSTDTSVEAPPEMLIMPDGAVDEPAYWKKFESLSYDDKVKVENGEYEVEGATKDTDTTTDTDTDTSTDTDTDTDTSTEVEEFYFTDETLAKLPDEQRKVIEAMEVQLKEDDQYHTEDFENLAKIVDTDPLIKRRIEEVLNGEDPVDLEGVAKKIDISSIATEKELKQIDFSVDPVKSLQNLSNLIFKALKAGAQGGYDLATVEGEEKVVFTQKVNESERQLLNLAKDMKMESKLPFSDPKNPLNPFVVWTRDTIPMETIDKLGENAQEALFAMYTTKVGGIEKLTNKIGATVRRSFIKSVTEIKNQTKTLGKTDRTNFVEPTNNHGIDEKKYMENPSYREEIWNKAKPEMRLKLEQLSYTGKLPN